MALGKKPTRGGRRPQVCRKEEPTRKLKGGHKKSKAREKDVQTPGLLISRNLPTKPAFSDLPVKPGNCANAICKPEDLSIASRFGQGARSSAYCGQC